MAELILRRVPTGFVCEQDELIPASWKIGEWLHCKVTRPRNLKLHRKAFALLNLVFKHCEYPTIDALRDAMTIGAGFVDPVTNPVTGEVSLVPKSWAFSGMDDLQFEALFSKLIDVALVIVPGSSRDDWEAVEQEISRW